MPENRPTFFRVSKAPKEFPENIGMALVGINLEGRKFQSGVPVMEVFGDESTFTSFGDVYSVPFNRALGKLHISSTAAWFWCLANLPDDMRYLVFTEDEVEELDPKFDSHPL